MDKKTFCLWSLRIWIYKASNLQHNNALIYLQCIWCSNIQYDYNVLIYWTRESNNEKLQLLSGVNFNVHYNTSVQLQNLFMQPFFIYTNFAIVWTKWMCSICQLIILSLPIIELWCIGNGCHSHIFLLEVFWFSSYLLHLPAFQFPNTSAAQGLGHSWQYSNNVEEWIR